MIKIWGLGKLSLYRDNIGGWWYFGFIQVLVTSVFMLQLGKFAVEWKG